MPMNRARATLCIVRRFQPVDRDGNGANASLHGALNPVVSQVARAGGNASDHAELRDFGGDDVPVLAQIGFAANERNLPNS